VGRHGSSTPVPALRAAAGTGVPRRPRGVVPRCSGALSAVAPALVVGSGRARVQRLGQDVRGHPHHARRHQRLRLRKPARSHHLVQRPQGRPSDVLAQVRQHAEDHHDRICVPDGRVL
ncbi:unnamed protein product, partial [Ectocarpus sp. 12 AP-2014]